MRDTLDEVQPNKEIKARNSLVAFLLSILTPGLGQIYNGQPNKAILFFIGVLFVPILFGFTRAITFFYGMVALVFLLIAFRIYVIVDAVKQARKQKQYRLKPYNTWYFHLLIGIAMMAILIIYSPNSVLGTQSFQIPSPVNAPNIQVGDYVVADLEAYKSEEPDYGDIIVFTRPDGLTYTFRVVGLPNDRIAIRDNIVSINGQTSSASFIQETESEGWPALEFEEILPNGHKHLIYKFKTPFDRTKVNMKELLVPANGYFVLGDNRDNAADSRFDGPVRRDRIKGRLVYSYWGEGFDRINIDFRKN